MNKNQNEDRKRCGPSHAKWFGEDVGGVLYYTN